MTVNNDAAHSHLVAVIDVMRTQMSHRIAGAAAKLGDGGDEFSVAARTLVAAGQAFLSACEANDAAVRSGYRG